MARCKLLGSDTWLLLLSGQSSGFSLALLEPFHFVHWYFIGTLQFKLKRLAKGTVVTDR